mmetsp:Transcript_13216/g.26268  ORF Transcript_13216/g.26268 Transcript_13216/m.26268 type:complete len:152 (+) Transcript_13216:233-688(+)|eukprot:CAMPEP_0182453072 /NCGR_PEP_ID=MMETSP1319-20130603/293_1 /TAXON_ID=172717 /ORGANISM="Bolidomonas pacifica, Strain RCC208" /LENGTH=151 /DNA_ID=CAMNT_0024650963 /DNA_START=192 /DNA_END=647 /DNA_ORIENTATION=-
MFKSVCVFLTLLSLVSSLKRGVVSTPDAPAAIGPYSQAITLTYASGETIVQAAGQIGLDPATGTLVEGGIEAEATRAMENIKAIMTAAGASMGEIVECTVLMTDLDDYAALNEIYATYFDEDNAPARAAVQVVKLPANATAEIKCSAAIET